ncbi:MAG: hypothetical protein JF592_10230 [Microbacterium sp.]|uniref:hypothetical protein n=1 Tax=Microbacterium sp. TaxID=51671 RepID=UPI001DC9A945|nr:hypothetical protein [Microbacterium sp.]MBW8762948.1 hypothetical protein [Microbacterium sp.]
MATHLIGYDLNKEKSYDDLIEAIKGLGSWWHHLDSTWIVRSTLTAKEVRDHLRPHLDADDELLVVDVTGRARAWRGFNKRGSDWLHKTWN